MDFFRIWIFILLSLPPLALAGSNSLKKQMLEQGTLRLKQDSEIQNYKKNQSLAFRKPLVIVHPHMQSVILKQIYLQTMPDGHKVQWEVAGGDVAAHHYVRSDLWVVDKKIENVNSFLSVKSPDQVVNLGLKKNDFEIHRKIMNGDPVYEVVIAGRALGGAGRIMVYSALTGELLWNYSRERHLDADTEAAHKNVVLDGRFNSFKSAKFADSDAVPADGFPELCQLISTHPKSKGEPLLIHPDKCEAGSDDSAKRAGANMKSVLDYYWHNHSQWGFDNNVAANTPILSVVHVGTNFDNAYWDEEGKFMVYGDGSGGVDRDSTNDYTLALDLAGHEFTHAIVSNTANFAGPGEPGAMNEAFADIFGILIRHEKESDTNWDIGAKIYNNVDGASDEIALRSLSEPGKFKTWTKIKGKSRQVGFPDRYSKRLSINQICTDENDQCEVHANSTIWSHAAYLFQQKLILSLRYSESDADKTMGELYFMTLTHKLRENDSMRSAGKAILQVCKGLLDESVCSLAKAALIETEIL